MVTSSKASIVITIGRSTQCQVRIQDLCKRRGGKAKFCRHRAFGHLDLKIGSWRGGEPPYISPRSAPECTGMSGESRDGCKNSSSQFDFKSHTH